MRIIILLTVLLLTGCSKSPSLTQTLQEVPATELVSRGDRIVYTGKDGALYAMDKTGAHKWKYSLTRVSTRYPPVVTETLVCVLSGSSLVGLNLSDGKKKWSFGLMGAVGPGTAGDAYIVAQGDRQLVLLNSANGKPVKKIGHGVPAGAAPVGLSDYACCVKLGPPPDPDDRLAVQMVSVHAYLVPSLEEMWVQDSEQGPSLTVSDDLVVFLKNIRMSTGSTTEAQAWDRKSGRKAFTWASGTKAMVTAYRPELAGETAFFSFTTGLDAFVVAMKDKELWRTQLPINAAGSVVVTPVARTRELVFVGEENRLVALDAATGKKKWAADEFEGKVVGSPVVLDGTVYVATDKKRLYGVKL